MKNRVVVFTTNNARTITNPKQLDVFRGKPNCLVNPDFSFVEGIEPHYWESHRTAHIPVQDAVRLKDIVARVVDKTRSTEISREHVYYATLLKHIDRELNDSSEACSKISQLLRKAEGINREEIAKRLEEDLIVNFNDEDLLPENDFYKALIKTWRDGVIMPMDLEDRQIRDKNISKYGADNWLNREKKMDTEFMVAIAALITLIVLGIIYR